MPQTYSTLCANVGTKSRRIRIGGKAPAFMVSSPAIRVLVCSRAVLTRVAAGHVRVGTFQYFAARGDQDALRELLAYVIRRHYP